MPVVFQMRLESDGSPTHAKRYVRLPPPVSGRGYELRLVLTAGSAALAGTAAFLETSLSTRRIAFEFAVDGGDAVARLEIRSAGVFEFAVVTATDDGTETRAKMGAVVVDPKLTVKNKLLPLDAVCCLTVVPKWMPTIDKWGPFLQSFAGAGYNMVHYAPLNMRGTSNSPYSIYDQLAFSNDLFEPGSYLSEDDKERQLHDVLIRSKDEFGILSITDVVWNHTAHNSKWLEEHPEAGYNLETAPHLRAAYELDEAIISLDKDLAQASIPTALQTEEHLTQVMHIFKDFTLPRLRLWEFYIVNVAERLSEFKLAWEPFGKTRDPDAKPDNALLSSGLKAWANALRTSALSIDTHLGTRFKKRVHVSNAVKLMERLTSGRDSTESVLKMYTNILNEVNDPLYAEANADIAAIVANVWSRARYLRVDSHGPKLGPISRKDPLVDTYFTRLAFNENTRNFHSDALCLANNGWIWNGDPLSNFAGPDSKAYLRRDVIAWGDCVKLRYGDGPESNPWLWQHQRAYTEKMARLFHGFRIDNCHSTPIHVATYLLDAARIINPDLYVIAELFTGSEETDVTFVSKLGINSLIREAMSAWDPKEMSRLVHRYGGTPIGSLTSKEEYFPLDMLGHTLDSTFFSPVVEEDVVIDVKGSSPHALFMDCTHDNETPHQKRTAEDTLPTAALVAMTASAVGSVKGFDEVVPELLNVVSETRKYRLAEPYEGIIPAKSILLNTHAKMAREGYTEIHVNQEHDYISVHRIHPITHDGYLLIARCAFNKYHGSDTHSPIVLRNQMVHIMESAGLRVQAPISDSMPGSQDELPSGPYGPHDTNAIQHAKDDRAHVRGRKTLGVISGLPCFLDFSPVLSTLVNVQEQDLNDGKSEFANMQTTITVNQDKFLPGSIVLFRTWMKGSGMDLVVPDPTMSPVPSPMRIAANLTLANTAGVDYNGVNPSTSPLLIKKLLMPKPKAAAAASILVSNYDQGYLEILWQLMGVENRNRGAEIMIQMGRDELDAGNLAFTSDLGVWPPGLWDAVSVLEDEDINIVLYRCAGEEWDSIGDGAYNIPGHGDLPYCGLQGFMSVIEQVARNNDLGHAICANLRAGPWMMDYVVGRLNKYSAKFPNMSKLAAWFEERFRIIKTLSPSFVPKYFFQLIFLAYCAVHFKAIAVLCSLHQQKFICPDSSTRRVSSLEVLAQQLALTTYQLYGRVNTTSLFPLAKYPETPFNDPHGVACLAAGLPHFSSRHMRCWGRDIFISLRGLFLIPGHFDAARSHLIAFASTLRHGLIPNLLDQGNFSRYNARDASWWWLYAVQQYCQSSPEGLTFLGTTVYRRFPPLRRYRQGPDYLKKDESSEIPGDEGDMYISTDDPKMYQHVSTIGQICHEILERHARGISFKEWNAGPNLDHAMQDAGFHVSCHTKFDNGSGLLFGGNRFNCGTWMDKMGDSEKAGTKGLPATPRDGAAVEIIGLLKATLRWITKEVLSSEHRNLIPATGVSMKDSNGNEKLITFAQWNDMLLTSFEKHFYIPKDPSDDKYFELDSGAEFIGKRGVYKDTVDSSQPFADVQFRPNFCVALVVAPELFSPERARMALDAVRDNLLGPLGMKTLYPKDWMYRGIYDNGNDSTDGSVAHGYNYHNGPEWGWLVGYFLRAYIHFNLTHESSKEEIKKVLHWTQEVILQQKSFIRNLQRNPYAGLPELTNANGEYCYGSCPTQAWSSATLLETVMDMYALSK